MARCEKKVGVAELKCFFVYWKLNYPCKLAMNGSKLKN